MRSQPLTISVAKCSVKYARSYPWPKKKERKEEERHYLTIKASKDVFNLLQVWMEDKMKVTSWEKQKEVLIGAYSYHNHKQQEVLSLHLWATQKAEVFENKQIINNNKVQFNLPSQLYLESDWTKESCSKTLPEPCQLQVVWSSNLRISQPGWLLLRILRVETPSSENWHV